MLKLIFGGEKNNGIRNNQPLICFRQSNEEGVSSALFSKSLPINGTMHRLLSNLVDQGVANELAPAYVKAKLTEIVLLQLNQLLVFLAKPTDFTTALKPQELDRMQRAKQLIEQQLKNPPRIAELASALGTNECYLKRHFKKTFGCTIYTYINNCRMTKAMDLLQANKKPIAEIARFLGYSNPSHFSSTFKKQYGFNPKRMHKQLLP